ncbi:hypothetical protein BX600DRAFT_516438 [Xylariales sp. PMI_506]|nr:hypothetical protein BX600DRAFT_516438 [Xylariales sp. PMI_506]
MASTQIRRRGSSVHTNSLDAVLAGTSSSVEGKPANIAVAPVPAPAPMPSPRVGEAVNSLDDIQSEFVLQPWKSSDAPVMGTPSETSETRSNRSGSTASRTANRLSLTLPIALPNSMPSRPTPTSVPPTPSESNGSVLNSPADPNDFIIAIAAQERRVLELREELERAERDLKVLRTKWKSSEAHKIRSPTRVIEPLRQITPSSADSQGSCDSPADSRSMDMERKKALLLGQGTPREHRRRIMRGGHTRTLSLLSPTKSEHDIPIHRDSDVFRSPETAAFPHRDFIAPPLNKRATWTPRQAQQPHAMKQIADDFRQGLWTFVEDLRQAAVGEEAISATTNRTSELPPRANRSNTDQDTIRASATKRGRVPFPMEPEVHEDTPSKAPGSFQDRAQHRRSSSRPETKARKHFSWTPLTFDDMGDDDWSNWDTPNGKSSRWSGSTVNGDIIPAVPERVEENESTLRKKRSRSDLRSSSPQTPAKLGELPAALLNSLTPSNIKRFSTDFMKEWEKSLSPPAETTTFEPSYQSIKDKAH